MRLILLALLIGAGLGWPNPANAITSAASAAAVESPMQVTITQARVPVYGIPGAPHTLLGYVKRGTALDLLGRSRDRKWWQVRTTQGPVWIAAEAAETKASLRRIKLVRAPAAPKVPKADGCTAIGENQGFTEGGLPDAIAFARDNTCVAYTLRDGSQQIWLWHPAGSTIELSPFAPVILRFGPWALNMQNLHGALMYANWVRDDGGELVYVAGAPIKRVKNVLYYNLTPLLQDKGKPGHEKWVLLTDVHILERVQ